MDTSFDRMKPIIITSFVTERQIENMVYDVARFTGVSKVKVHLFVFYFLSIVM